MTRHRSRTPAPACAREAELCRLEIRRNRRLMQLAALRDLPIETFERGDSRWWRVPEELVAVVGCMAARV